MPELTLIEAAARLGCHPTTVRRMLRRGDLRFSRRFDGRIRIKLADVEALLAGHDTTRATLERVR